MATAAERESIYKHLIENPILPIDEKFLSSKAYKITKGTEKINTAFGNVTKVKFINIIGSRGIENTFIQLTFSTVDKVLNKVLDRLGFTFEPGRGYMCDDFSLDTLVSVMLIKDKSLFEVQEILGTELRELVSTQLDNPRVSIYDRTEYPVPIINYAMGYFCSLRTVYKLKPALHHYQLTTTQKIDKFFTELNYFFHDRETYGWVWENKLDKDLLLELLPNTRYCFGEDRQNLELIFYWFMTAQLSWEQFDYKSIEPAPATPMEKFKLDIMKLMETETDLKTLADGVIKLSVPHAYS